MFVSFSLSGFRSFLHEQTLTMVADPAEKKNLAEHLSPLPVGHDGDVLPLAMVYGPNAAGKSNLLRGLDFLRQSVLDGFDGVQPFSFAGEIPATECSVRFTTAHRLLEYGFEATQDTILSEWLVEVTPDDSPDKVLFERTSTQELTLGDELTTGPAAEKMLALKALGPKTNELLLHSALRNVDRDQLPESFQEATQFLESIVVISAGASFINLAGRIAQDTTFKEHIVKVLRAADTGVCDLETKTEFVDSDDTTDRLARDGGTGIPLPHGAYLEFGEGKNTLTTLSCGHETSSGTIRELDFSEESDGTQRLAHLAPALSSAGKTLYIIDELDRSLHPLLARRFLELFLSHCRTTGSQLVVTAHETTLLTQELLRRDEIWFVEKTHPDLASVLSSLSEFKVRKDRRLARSYLAGRFGAVPHFDEFKLLNRPTEVQGPDAAAKKAG
ncbi:MAG: ATP-binding protein [Nannocystaceae bacterium]|nr:ATP-binding protein [Nannocystaceae bacterium]